MTKIGDGGSAFPRQLPDVRVPPDRALEMIGEYSGMSLRDWFAGQALSGQLAFSPPDSFEQSHQPDDVAATCYRYADALIAARGSLLECLAACEESEAGAARPDSVPAKSPARTTEEIFRSGSIHLTIDEQNQIANDMGPLVNEYLIQVAKDPESGPGLARLAAILRGLLLAFDRLRDS